MSSPRTAQRDGKRLAAKFREVRKTVAQIAEAFDPVRVILFGSHARGDARPESDVDLLVVTDHLCRPDESLRIRRSVDYSFPLDLIACDSQRLGKRITAGDFFLQDAVENGKVLYERTVR